MLNCTGAIFHSFLDSQKWIEIIPTNGTWGTMEFEEVHDTFQSFVPDLRICMDGLLTSTPVTRDTIIWNLGSLGVLLRARHMN